MVMGGIVPVVNLDGVKSGDLVLDGPTLAKIFIGKITKWNDPAIKTLNPKAKLPRSRDRRHPSRRRFGHDLQLHQLSRQGLADWESKVGVATSVEWPVGIGAKGNDGVANNVAGTKGAIGYVEYAYAKQNQLTYTDMVNKAGKVVAPTMDAFQAAAANADWAKRPASTDPDRSAGRRVLADDRRDLHPDVQEAGRRRGLQRRAEILQLGLRQGRQDGEGSRLHPDARQGRRLVKKAWATDIKQK